MKRTLIDPSSLELEDSVVTIKRVTKTVKGGRNMRFSALVVVGDRKGHVGVGIGKAVEIPEAIRKGKEDAMKNLIEAPINENGSIVNSMIIAGAVAGLAGGIMLLSGTGRHIEVKDVIPNEGFNGISVALLGVSNPIGIIFSGLFIAYLTAGGFYLQLFHFSKEIIDIIIAVIIYFSAFALIVKMVIENINKKNEMKKGGA